MQKRQIFRSLFFAAVAVLPFQLQAQGAEWVEIDSFQESAILGPNQSHSTWNERTYRYELGGTETYYDDELYEFTVWSMRFQPILIIRETTSANGQAGYGQIIARGEGRDYLHEGNVVFANTISFRPPETGVYRMVITSVDDLASGFATGAFSVQGRILEWRAPDVVEPDPPSNNAVGCTMPNLTRMNAGGYNPLWMRDSLAPELYEFYFRSEPTNYDYQRAQESGPRLAPIYPDYTFMGMFTPAEICEIIAGRCTAAEGFNASCAAYGHPSMPDRRYLQ